MASRSLTERLASKVAAAAGDGDGAAVDTTDVSGGVGADSDESTSTDHITETAEGAAEAAPAEPEADPEKAEAEKVRASRAALLEEKLAQAREKRQAQRLADRAKADRRAAKAERDAATAERAKYDGLRTGTYAETLKALGRDPREAFEEMSREAIEASTPEAAARREKEAAERALEERFSPIVSELEQLRAERAQLAAETHAARLHSSFQQAVTDPAFEDLRIEYPDDALLDHANHYDRHPDQFRAVAQQFGVRLTDPNNGFTMHELLQVLSAAQAEHNAGVQARRAALRPAEQRSAQPTVNGTAPRRNADSRTGNEHTPSGSSPASDDSALSPKDRMRMRARAEIRRSGG